MNAWCLAPMMGLGIALAVCLVKLRLQARECLRLSEQLERFLSGETQTPAFSVRDNRFALFENAVIELETSLLQSRENEREESRRTAQLLADVSHQLKTPLAGLRLYCELDAARHQKESLQLIEHMEKLIYSLLRLEKLRAGAYELNFQMLTWRIWPGRRPGRWARCFRERKFRSRDRLQPDAMAIGWARR